VTEQAVRLPTIAATTHAAQADGTLDKGTLRMGLILLEALLALVVLIAIVWWTMFAGRSKGELPPPVEPPETDRNKD
jgi:hypothetical protein